MKTMMPMIPRGYRMRFLVAWVCVFSACRAGDLGPETSQDGPDDVPDGQGDGAAQCVPATCAEQGASCGTIDDGCGATLACGTCTAPETCGGGRVANECGCPGAVVEGDVSVTDAASLDALVCTVEITGSLHFHQTCGIDEVVLPRLERIGGALYFHQTGVQQIDLPALTSVGQYLYFHQNAALADVGLPSLESVGQYLYLYGNCALSVLDLESLVSVGDYFYVDLVAALPSLSAPALTSVGGYFYVSRCCALADLDFPQLTTVGGSYVYVATNPSLPQAEADALGTQLLDADYGGSLYLSGNGSGSCSLCEAPACDGP